MEYTEYGNLSNFNFSKIENDEYSLIHEKMPVLCHDVFIKYREGILLVKRKVEPGKGEYWPVGGRVQKNTPIEKSLIKKTKEECNLELKKIKLLSFARFYFKKDPFRHGHGTDTPSLIFFAEGSGNLKLDKNHEKPIIIKKENLKDYYVDKFIIDSFRLLESEGLI